MRAKGESFSLRQLWAAAFCFAEQTGSSKHPSVANEPAEIQIVDTMNRLKLLSPFALRPDGRK